MLSPARFHYLDRRLLGRIHGHKPNKYISAYFSFGHLNSTNRSFRHHDSCLQLPKLNLQTIAGMEVGNRIEGEILVGAEFPSIATGGDNFEFHLGECHADTDPRTTAIGEKSIVCGFIFRSIQIDLEYGLIYRVQNESIQYFI
jgi:hypothetical protein